MPDGVVTESSIGANAPVKPELSKSPWGFLKSLRRRFKRSPVIEEPYKTKDPEVPVIEWPTEEEPKVVDKQQEIPVEQPDPKRLWFESSIMETANKPDFIYGEACRFLDVGAISAMPPIRTDASFTEACHKIETAAYLHRVLIDFAGFVKTKAGFSLDDAYDFATGAFYTRKEGKFDHEAPQKYIRSMVNAIKEVEDFIDTTKRSQGGQRGERTIYHQKDFHWHNVGVYGSEGYSPTMGRIYLNPKPEFAGRVFQELAVSLIKDTRVSFVMKTLEPTDGVATSTYHLNRPDKIVIYFNSQNEAEMLAILQDFYNGISSQQPPILNNEIPPFATGLVEPTYRWKMSGMAFAQNPPLDSKDSVNEKMKRILYGVSSFVTDDQNNQDRVEHEFMRLAKEAGLDPYEPAFYKDGQKSFPAIAANASYV